MDSWVWPVVGSKGLELEILFFGSTIFVLTAYIAAVNFKKIPLVSTRLVEHALILALVGKLITTFPATIAVSANIAAVTLLLFFTVITIFVLFRYQKYIKRYLSILFAIFAAIVILSIQEIHDSDFNFFVGPALKLHQGEPLGSFFIQYGILEIYLFKFMIDLGLKLHHMQLTLALIFICFLFLYYKVAKSQIKDRFLVYLFMFSLIIFRFLALKFHTISSPQATPMRLDLWVPLFLITSKFGFFSPISSASFALAYIADDVFGFVTLSVYITAIAFLTIRAVLVKEIVNFKNLFLLFIPITSAFLIHLYFFKSITSPAAKLFNELQYWRLVISPYSMYWPFLLIFPLFLYLTLTRKNQFQKQLSVFLLGLALVEMIYFFGRSHENNLMATSGILLLIFFMTLERLKEFYKKGISIYVAPIVLIMAITIMFSQNIILNLTTAFERLKSGQIFKENRIDRDIDQNPVFMESYQTKKIYLMGFNDAYLNYRYNLNQVGYYSPFVANLFKKETIKLLEDLESMDYVILYEEGSWFNIAEYNDYLKNTNIEFLSEKSKSLGNLQFYELKVAKKH